MHVYVPIERGPTQKEVWTFAKAPGGALEQRYPKLVTAEYRIAKRPHGRVLVDYNQNAWGRTLASVYSVRPTQGATVSTPVTWTEIERGCGSRSSAAERAGARAPRSATSGSRSSRPRPVPAGGAAVSLPIADPYPPMEAQLVERCPTARGWQYEPKWDGFRCLAFRDGDEVAAVQVRAAARTLLPGVARLARALAAPRFVLDGELVIPVGGRLSFDDLLMRIHPAASRVRTLARAHPSLLVLFDLLVDAGGQPWRRSRSRAPRAAGELLPGGFRAQGDLRRALARHAPLVARRWLLGAGGNLDGVMAKRQDCAYRSGERDGMRKVKLIRTADCVVGGFRYSAEGPVVGSLLLGLYDEEGLLHHIGFASGFRASEREPLTRKLEPLVQPPGFTGRAPGGPSRWSHERSASGFRSAGAGGRGSVRPLYRRPLPSRRQAAPLAPGQGAKASTMEQLR